MTWLLSGPNATRSVLALSFCLAAIASGCGDEEGGTESDRLGVAAECSSTDECATYPLADGGTGQLACLTDFKGGYCGLKDCERSADCPDGALCVAHTDGSNYCFRACAEKPECNANRTVDDEANCSSSFDWANEGDDDGSKACIPPSGK